MCVRFNVNGVRARVLGVCVCLLGNGMLWKAIS